MVKSKIQEKEILVPKLPQKCTNCKEIIEDSKTWKYHVLAHKFGEVFCATCMKCVLGHQFSDHKIACTSNKKGVAKARVEKYYKEEETTCMGQMFRSFNDTLFGPSQPVNDDNKAKDTTKMLMLM